MLKILVLNNFSDKNISVKNAFLLFLPIFILSMTENVYAQTGTLFGGRYDADLGLNSSIKINVFDTPGFSDTNVDNIRKNKFLIASSLKNNIHMIIFVSPNPRFDNNNQLSLQMINEWTSGKMWKNLLITKARTTFDRESIRQRYKL